MLKNIFFAITAAALSLLNPQVPLANENYHVTISDDIDIGKLFNTATIKADSISTEADTVIDKNWKIECTVNDQYNLVFSFPDKPVQVTYKMVPGALAINITAQGWNKWRKEYYHVRLAGFGTDIKYECQSGGLKVSGTADVSIVLVLNTELIKEKHMNTLLNSVRSFSPVTIAGVVRNTNDFLVKQKEKYGGFDITITLHPLAINGEPLF